MTTVRDFTQMEFSAAKEIVRRYLASHESCRNSDKELMWRIWVHEQHLLIQDLEQFMKGLPAETITRARREIQNDENQYLPTLPGVLTQRRIKEDAIKEYFGKNSSEWQRYVGHKYDVVTVASNKNSGMGALLR